MIIWKSNSSTIRNLKPKTWSNPNNTVESRYKCEFLDVAKLKVKILFAMKFRHGFEKKLYGRPWETGIRYFETLKTLGVKKESKVLDIGCGSGRVGRQLIQFLNEGNYVGTDPHEFALRSFEKFLKNQKDSETLLYLGRIEDYEEILISNFDFIVDLYCSHHFSLLQFERYVLDLSLKLKYGGKVIWLGDANKWEYILKKHFKIEIYDDGVDAFLILESKKSAVKNRNQKIK